MKLGRVIGSAAAQTAADGAGDADQGFEPSQVVPGCRRYQRRRRRSAPGPHMLAVDADLGERGPRLKRRTTPLTPSSCTRMLLPTPRTRSGSFCSMQSAGPRGPIPRRCRGSTQASAGPPTLRRVQGASGCCGLRISRNSESREPISVFAMSLSRRVIFDTSQGQSHALSRRPAQRSADLEPATCLGLSRRRYCTCTLGRRDHRRPHRRDRLGRRFSCQV